MYRGSQRGRHLALNSRSPSKLKVDPPWARQGTEHPFDEPGAVHAREGREPEGHAGAAPSAEEIDEPDEEELHDPVDAVRPAAHEVDVAEPGAVLGEDVRERDDAAVCVAHDGDLGLAERIRVEAPHREGALTVPTGREPGVGHVLQLAHGRVIDVMEHLERAPDALHPLQGRAQRLHRRAAQIELVERHHGLFADLEVAEPVGLELRAVVVANLVERRDPPVGLAVLAERDDGRPPRFRGTDWTAERDGGGRDDPVADHRVAVGGEHPRLVVEEQERGERGVTVALEQLGRHGAGRRRPAAHGPRPPRRAGEPDEHDQEHEHPHRVDEPRTVGRRGIHDRCREQDHHAEAVVERAGDRRWTRGSCRRAGTTRPRRTRRCPTRPASIPTTACALPGAVGGAANSPARRAMSAVVVRPRATPDTTVPSRALAAATTIALESATHQAPRRPGSSPGSARSRPAAARSMRRRASCSTPSGSGSIAPYGRRRGSRP